MTTSRPVALVTGASSGIGKAATLALVDAGFQVIGTSRDTSRATPGDGVTFLDLDVTSDESVTSVVKQVIARFGRIDVLVNNAGVGSNGAAEEISAGQAQTVFDANVVRADTPLPVYAHRRRVFEDVMTEEMRGGDDPTVVATVIAKAATDSKPESRYLAGATAGRVAVLRRVVPARLFDKSIRKLNRMVD